jgi:hypothetical protein
MVEPKLELKKANKRLASLEIVKAKAASRTKRRIAQIIEEQELKEAEANLLLEEEPATKKG